MVPFDDKSPFVTSGIRIGTAAVTTRGLVEGDMHEIANFIDKAIEHHDNDELLENVAASVQCALRTSVPNVVYVKIGTMMFM